MSRFNNHPVITTMSNNARELELLALIEGELSAADQAMVRQRLAAGDPDMLAAVDDMIDQRRGLRIMGSRQPQLPCDFVAELEPMLARTMLLGDGITPVAQTTTYMPGQARRQRRRQFMPRRVAELAIAAMLMMAVGTGLLSAGWGLGWWRSVPSDSGESQIIADSSTGQGSIQADGRQQQASTAATDQDRFAALLAGNHDLHHELTADTLRSMSSGSAAAQSGRAIGTVASPTRLAASVALVLDVSDPAAFEIALINGVTTVAGDANSAVVRNFTFADARQLEADWRRHQRSAPQLDPAMASLDGKSTADRRAAERYFRELARRAEAQLQSIRGTQPSNASPSRIGVASLPPGPAHLAGTPQLSPDTEQQLRFSAAGATHTISISVRNLSAVLTRLTAADMHSEAMLSMFEPINLLDRAPELTTDRAASTAERIRHMLEVRASLDAMLHSNPDAIVMLPVIVR